MAIEHNYQSNWFPYNHIEYRIWNDKTPQLTYTDETKTPNEYDNACVGRWNIKYKNINPKFSLVAQGIKPTIIN